MSQLIQLKQRIKAIDTIKKITKTMQLIAMSSHSKLKKQSEATQRFRNEVRPILCALTKESEHLIEPKKPKYKNLFIIFGAEKGLCESFNNLMFAYFDIHLTPETLENSHVICVGKKVMGYLQKRNIVSLMDFEKVLPKRLEIIAQELYEKINKIHKNYESVICLSSYPKTFSIQEPQTTTLIPIRQDPCDLFNKLTLDEHEWLQDKKSVTKGMFQILLKINVLLLLTNSMLSEQSARFLAMDTATRSADDLLKQMKLDFNKLRQAKITRELIELTSNV